MYRCTNLSFIKLRSSRTRRLFGSTTNGNNYEIKNSWRNTDTFWVRFRCRTYIVWYVRHESDANVWFHINNCNSFFLHPIGYLRNSVDHRFPSEILMNTANTERICIKKCSKFYKSKDVRKKPGTELYQYHLDEDLRWWIFESFLLFIRSFSLFHLVCSLSIQILYEYNWTELDTQLSRSVRSHRHMAFEKKNQIIIQFDPLIYQLPFLIFSNSRGILNLKRYAKHIVSLHSKLFNDKTSNDGYFPEWNLKSNVHKVNDMCNTNC